ncbi:hypothetical protein [Arthrobacter sp. IK3]|uniref:hypothetical protein n=1 Tax=Arthrobacter sp. IK3 TaxID=3448169 RepID=UPI003EE3DB80
MTVDQFAQPGISEPRHASSPVTYGVAVGLFDRMDGSYFHPAPSATAEHCITFWGTVHIPDEIITQVENAYYRDRQQEIEEDMEETMRLWTVEWMKANPEPGNWASASKVEEYNQRWRDEHEVHRLKVLPSVEAKRPLALGSYDAPQIIRAAQMNSNRPDPKRWPGEATKVMLHPVELFEGEMTVGDIGEKYRLARILSYIQKPIKTDIEARILEAIGETNQLLHAWQFERGEDRVAAREERYR